MSSQMKCVATGSFTQILPSQLEDVPDHLSLFVALCPNQFLELCSEQPVIPDPFSGRFGLRATQLIAVQRAHEFMNWRQEGRERGQDGHFHQKKFVVCTMKIFPLGYMMLMEEGTSEKGDGHNFYRDGYFRWNGRLQISRTVISKGVADERFMYLFMVVLQVCIVFPKTHFGSRGYSFDCFVFFFFFSSQCLFVTLWAHAF